MTDQACLDIPVGTPVLDKKGQQVGKVLRSYASQKFDRATTVEILASGLIGHLWSADIHVSKAISENGWGLFATASTIYDSFE